MKNLKKKLSNFTGRAIDEIDENFVLEINWDSILGQQIVGFLVKFSDDKVQEIRRLPTLKRIRIENVGTMISDIRLIIKYWIPERLQIMNFNVNGSLIDLSLFINRMWENVVKKVNNLYLYYMSLKEGEVIKMWNAIKLNDHFQDLRLYACKFDISLLAENFVENHSIWLISLSFNHLKAADADDFITLIGKLKVIKEICAHHNNFEDEGWNKIASYISENLIDQVEYVDLLNNQTKTNQYIKILEEKGFKGVIK